MLKGPEIRAHGDAVDDKKVVWLEWSEQWENMKRAGKRGDEGGLPWWSSG